ITQFTQALHDDFFVFLGEAAFAHSIAVNPGGYRRSFPVGPRLNSPRGVNLFRQAALHLRRHGQSQTVKHRRSNVENGQFRCTPTLTNLWPLGSENTNMTMSARDDRPS